MRFNGFHPCGRRFQRRTHETARHGRPGPSCRRSRVHGVLRRIEPLRRDRFLGSSRLPHSPLAATGFSANTSRVSRPPYDGNGTGGTCNEEIASLIPPIEKRNRTWIQAETAPVVGECGLSTPSEKHYSIVIVISQSSRSITSYRGYGGEVIETKTLDNTKPAFNDLIKALNRAGYMKENISITQDPLGICAVGQLIQFEMLDGDNSVKTRDMSCAKLEGNFAGLDINVEQLLIDQNPPMQGKLSTAPRAYGNLDP